MVDAGRLLGSFRGGSSGTFRYCLALAINQGAAKRLEGNTKAGIVGKGPSTTSASPSRKPNHDRQHAIGDDVSQLASSQFVWSQGRVFPATGTTLLVAMSISRIRSHQFVVPLDQRPEIVHVQGIDCLRRSEVANAKKASLLFCCALASAATEGGGVLDVIYRSGVKGGIPAG